MAQDHYWLILYVSELRSGLGPGVVTEIVRVAGLRNARMGISGALLFDGECFAQLLEGSQGTLESLLRRLHRDRRHCNLRILVNAKAVGTRRDTSWSMGYRLLEDEIAGIGSLCALSAAAALEAFDALVPLTDFGPEEERLRRPDLPARLATA